MAGRHRAPDTRSTKLPAAAGAAVAMLILAVWAVIGLQTDDDAERPSMAAMSAPTSSTSTTTTTTTTTTKSSKKKKTSTSKAKPKPTKTTTAAPTTTTTEPPVRLCPSTLEGTQPHVAQVGNHVLGKFDVDSVGGKAGRGGDSDHPSGLALDFMVDTEAGNALAEYVLANQSDFGVSYVIWQQRYNDGSGWSQMEDRGSATANHYDHVHVSFRAGGDVSVTC